VTRPATKTEVRRKDEKEKIIVFRESLVSQFKQRQIRDMVQNIIKGES